MNLKMTLSYACGYAELGLHRDARKELASIPLEYLADPSVLETKTYVFSLLKDWAAMETAALALRALDPENVSGWIHTAYACRRARSIAEARDILLEALELFPKDATIHYNLACYAAQTNDLPKARELLKRAIALLPEFYETAKQDDDLKPLWPELRALKSKAR